MHKDLSPILSSFGSITLSEMDGVKLMDRIDTKFVFNYDQLENILGNLSSDYKVLDVNGVKQNRYETLYFDTPNFKLYLDHHNKRPQRYKVRCRRYVDSDLVFFEVKYKNNKGRTLKSRVKVEDVNGRIDDRSIALVKDKTTLSPEELQSKLWVNYSRITLVNKYSPERLTLDLDLTFINGDQVVSYNNLVIAEVKQAKLTGSPFINVMKNSRIREGSISKYCFGVVTLIENIKKNSFKSKLLTLNKLSNEIKIKTPY